jgi:hypothetical protein
LRFAAIRLKHTIAGYDYGLGKMMCVINYFPNCENKKMPNSQNIIVQKAAAMLPMVLDL